MRFLSYLARICLLLSLAGTSWGQVTTARLYGVVTDPTASRVPGATVTLTREETGTLYTKQTDTGGEFQFDFLPPGTYELQIQAAGFKAHRETGLQLTAAQSTRQNYSLELGNVTETVEVAAAAEQLNTINSEQRQTIENKEVTELPIARRNYSNLLALGTGAAKNRSGAVRMNGIGGSGGKVTVDGTDATQNAESNTVAMFNNFNYIDTLSIDAIDEVQITKGVIPAEYGQALSGNVNVISKSGTNEWHGRLFENFQADNLNARDPFLSDKTPLTFNQFGGSVGGPLKKNKIFVFATYEGYRERRFSQVDGDVFTQKYRDEMLAAVPEYELFLRIIPLPNQPHDPDGDAGRFLGAGGESAHDNHVNIKADILLTDSSALAATYTRFRPFRSTSRYSDNGREWNGIVERGSLNFTTGGPTWTSESRFGYNFNETARIESFFFAMDPITAETQPGGRRVPRMDVAGFDDGGGSEDNTRYGTLWSLEEKFAVHRGKHSLKLGGIYVNRESGRVNIENPVLRYETKEEVLNNTPSRTQVFFGIPRYVGRNYDWGLFAQDDWRVASNLVVNLGVRYDFFSHYVASAEDPSLSAGFFNLDGLLDDQFNFGPFRDPDNPVESDGSVNIGPRVGFSYDVGGRGTTVIRGGWSVMFGPQPKDDYNSAVGRSPDIPRDLRFSRAETAELGLRFPVYNEDVLKLVTASDQIQVGSVFDPRIQNPYSMNTYFGIQRDLGQSLMLESAFVATNGVKFRLRRNFNEVDRITGIRPNPGLGSGLYFDSTQNSQYYSWQTSLRKRYSRNFLGNLHYTWSKALSVSGGDTGATFSGDTVTTIQDFFDVKANKGPSSGDVTHNFIADYLYETPSFSQLANPILRHLLGSWQISGVFSAQTGFPLVITQGSTIASSRPDYIGGDPINANAEQTRQYLNRDAFARVPVVSASRAPIRPGTLGNGAIRLPGAWNLDFSMGKNLSLSEAVRLQLRADMFNIMNHTSFNAITTNITSGNFGRFTNTTPARVIQVNARFSW